MASPSSSFVPTEEHTEENEQSHVQHVPSSSDNVLSESSTPPGTTHAVPVSSGVAPCTPRTAQNSLRQRLQKHKEAVTSPSWRLFSPKSAEKPRVSTQSRQNSRDLPLDSPEQRVRRHNDDQHLSTLDRSIGSLSRRWQSMKSFLIGKSSPSQVPPPRSLPPEWNIERGQTNDQSPVEMREQQLPEHTAHNSASIRGGPSTLSPAERPRTSRQLYSPDPSISATRLQTSQIASPIQPGNNRPVSTDTQTPTRDRDSLRSPGGRLPARCVLSTLSLKSNPKAKPVDPEANTVNARATITRQQQDPVAVDLTMQEGEQRDTVADTAIESGSEESIQRYPQRQESSSSKKSGKSYASRRGSSSKRRSKGKGKENEYPPRPQTSTTINPDRPMVRPSLVKRKSRTQPEMTKLAAQRVLEQAREPLRAAGLDQLGMIRANLEGPLATGNTVPDPPLDMNSSLVLGELAGRNDPGSSRRIAVHEHSVNQQPDRAFVAALSKKDPISPTKLDPEDARKYVPMGFKLSRPNISSELGRLIRSKTQGSQACAPNARDTRATAPIDIQVSAQTRGFVRTRSSASSARLSSRLSSHKSARRARRRSDQDSLRGLPESSSSFSTTRRGLQRTVGSSTEFSPHRIFVFDETSVELRARSENISVQDFASAVPARSGLSIEEDGERAREAATSPRATRFDKTSVGCRARLEGIAVQDFAPRGPTRSDRPNGQSDLPRFSTDVGLTRYIQAHIEHPHPPRAEISEQETTGHTSNETPETLSSARYESTQSPPPAVSAEDAFATLSFQGTRRRRENRAACNLEIANIRALIPHWHPRYVTLQGNYPRVRLRPQERTNYPFLEAFRATTGSPARRLPLIYTASKRRSSAGEQPRHSPSTERRLHDLIYRMRTMPLPRPSTEVAELASTDVDTPDDDIWASDEEEDDTHEEGPVQMWSHVNSRGRGGTSPSERHMYDNQRSLSHPRDAARTNRRNFHFNNGLEISVSTNLPLPPTQPPFLGISEFSIVPAITPEHSPPKPDADVPGNLMSPGGGPHGLRALRSGKSSGPGSPLSGNSSRQSTHQSDRPHESSTEMTEPESPLPPESGANNPSSSPTTSSGLRDDKENPFPGVNVVTQPTPDTTDPDSEPVSPLTRRSGRAWPDPSSTIAPKPADDRPNSISEANIVPEQTSETGKLESEQHSSGWTYTDRSTRGIPLSDDGESDSPSYVSRLEMINLTGSSESETIPPRTTRRVAPHTRASLSGYDRSMINISDLNKGKATLEKSAGAQAQGSTDVETATPQEQNRNDSVVDPDFSAQKPGPALEPFEGRRVKREPQRRSKDMVKIPELVQEELNSSSQTQRQTFARVVSTLLISADRRCKSPHHCLLHGERKNAEGDESGWETESSSGSSSNSSSDSSSDSSSEGDSEEEGETVHSWASQSLRSSTSVRMKPLSDEVRRSFGFERDEEEEIYSVSPEAAETEMARRISLRPQEADEDRGQHEETHESIPQRSVDETADECDQPSYGSQESSKLKSTRSVGTQTCFPPFEPSRDSQDQGEAGWKIDQATDKSRLTEHDGQVDDVSATSGLMPEQSLDVSLTASQDDRVYSLEHERPEPSEFRDDPDEKALEEVPRSSVGWPLGIKPDVESPSLETLQQLPDIWDSFVFPRRPGDQESTSASSMIKTGQFFGWKGPLKPPTSDNSEDQERTPTSSPRRLPIRLRKEVRDLKPLTPINPQNSEVERAKTSGGTQDHGMAHTESTQAVSGDGASESRQEANKSEKHDRRGRGRHRRTSSVSLSAELSEKGWIDQ